MVGWQTLLVALVGFSHPAVSAQPGILTLPPPRGAPQAIDFSSDELLGFGRTTMPTQPFLETLGTAVEKHPAVAAAIAEQQAFAAVKVQVRAGLFPRIDAQLLHNRTLARDFGDRAAVVESLQPRVRTDLTLTGDQLLYDFGATGSRIAAANERILAARAEIERVADDTALRAVVAWYDVLAFQTLADLSGAMITRQQSILSDVRTRVAQGVGAGGDVARAEAVLADTQVESARFSRSLDQAKLRFREVFGVDAPERLTRAQPPASAALSIDAARMLGRLAPEVVAARRRAEAALRDYRAAKADGLPRLSLGANAARYDVFTSSDYEVRGSVVLRHSLFAGGRQRGIIAEQRARARNADFIAERVVGESERDAGIAFTDLAALRRTVTTLEAGYVANRRVRDGYVEQFRVARGTLIELLRAERDYFNAATGYVQGVIEMDVAQYALLARTGEMLPAIGLKLVI